MSKGSAAAWREGTGSRTHEEVLPCAVGHLDVLLERRHEPVARLDALRDLRVVHLEEHAELARDRIPDLGDLRAVVGGQSQLSTPRATLAGTHLVSGASDLDEGLCGDGHLLRLDLQRLLGREAGGVIVVLCCSPGEVRLMLLALGVGEVGALVRVESEAQPALEAAEVVPKDVRVLRAHESATGGWERRAGGRTFARSIVSSASFRRRSRRSRACASPLATPPPPNLLPTRFCGRGVSCGHSTAGARGAHLLICGRDGQLASL